MYFAFPELSEGTIFEQIAFSDLCFYIKMEHFGPVMLMRFHQKKIQLVLGHTELGEGSLTKLSPTKFVLFNC